MLEVLKKRLERQFFVVLQYMLDVALHAHILFAWATIRLIFDVEFPEFSAKSSALIFTLSLSLTGFWLIFVGWIRDSISFGWSRIETGVFIFIFSGTVNQVISDQHVTLDF